VLNIYGGLRQQSNLYYGPIIGGQVKTERLKITKGLRYVDTLIQELGNFRVKITTKDNDTYESWREGQHDDLVLSVALASWYGENMQPNFMIVEEPLEEGVFEL